MLFYLGRQRALDADVQASPGALANFYVSGSSVRQDTWQNAALTIPHANPVAADDYGLWPPIYLDPALTYKVIITDRDGAALPDGTIDPLVQAAFSQAQIGSLLYPRTVAESDAAVTPTNYAYLPGSVCRYGAVGDDSTDCSTAFSSAFAVANASNEPIEITFPEGVYRTSTSQNWFKRGITLRALGRVVIRSTATSGSVMQFDAGAATNGYLCRMLGDFMLDSTNAGVSYGLYTRNVHHSVFECAARNISQAGLFIQGAVLNKYRFECSDNSTGAFTTEPVAGVRIEGSGIISATTACDFELTLEVATDTGLLLTAAHNCGFWGTSEGIAGLGMYIAAGSQANIFHNFFLEANETGDIDCDGDGNIFINCTASSRAASPPYESVKSIIFGAGAERNQWNGGFFYAASVEATALHNAFISFDSDFKVEDAGTNTMVWGRQDNISASMLVAKIPIQEDFSTLTTINSWANTSGTFQAPQYTLNRSTNEVLVRGEAGGGALGTVIATLPAGFRPAKQYTFICPATAGSADAVVNVQADGDVQHVSGDTTSIDLSAIRFFV